MTSDWCELSCGKFGVFGVTCKYKTVKLFAFLFHTVQLEIPAPSMLFMDKQCTETVCLFHCDIHELLSFFNIYLFKSFLVRSASTRDVYLAKLTTFFVSLFCVCLSGLTCMSGMLPSLTCSIWF